MMDKDELRICYESEAQRARYCIAEAENVCRNVRHRILCHNQSQRFDAITISEIHELRRMARDMANAVRGYAQWAGSINYEERDPSEVGNIIGKWPGDETDEEFDAMMREHEEKD